MRKASACFAALLAGLAVPALPSVASATPTVAFTAKLVPIPGFGHTGDILGAGTDIALNYRIGGSEYFGSPPPVIGVNFYAPKGTVVDEDGFPTCAEKTLVDVGPMGCPRGSTVGHGSVVGDVTFGGERVGETAELFAFFKPGGGIEYLVDGHTPVVIEILAKAHYSHLGGVDGYGFELEEEFPLVPTVPGAPYASVQTVTGTFGAASRSHGRTTYYARVPRMCPKGGFLVKTEAIFAQDGERSRTETVTAYYTIPCPPRDRGARR